MLLHLIRDRRDIKDINLTNAVTVARWIKEKHPAVSVYITGSVLKPRLIHPGSDIDLVVEGIKEMEYDALIKDIHHKFPFLKVDIRRMEEMDSYMKQKIKNRGYRV